MTWDKHQKEAAQQELEAAIRGTRSLPQNNVGMVHNFQDVLTEELNGCIPGATYFQRRAERKFGNQKKDIPSCKCPSPKHDFITFNKHT